MKVFRRLGTAAMLGCLVASGSLAVIGSQAASAAKSPIVIGYITDQTGVASSTFVDGPGGAVMDADKLLGDVMSTRGYPMSDFEQRAADISVDHPLILDNYRAAHQGALRQTRGQANTEDLRQAMIHFRTLFEELVGPPETARAHAV